MTKPFPKSRSELQSGDRVAISDLLRLLSKLGLTSADPLFPYCGGSARMDQVLTMLQLGLIDDATARKRLGFK